MASGSNFFQTMFWVLRTGLASQALRKLFAGRTAWPAFRAKARNHNFLFWGAAAVASFGNTETGRLGKGSALSTPQTL